MFIEQRHTNVLQFRQSMFFVSSTFAYFHCAATIPPCGTVLGPGLGIKALRWKIVYSPHMPAPQFRLDFCRSSLYITVYVRSMYAMLYTYMYQFKSFETLGSLNPDHISQRMGCEDKHSSP